MSSPQSSLIAVLEQAEAARDEAQALFESSRKALEAARRQLQSLHDFRQQYETRWQGQFRTSGGVEIMRCYQDFMTRLRDAEADQQRRVDHCEQASEHRRLELIERERKVAAVAQLMKRREQEQAQREQRREQKATDEIAARLTSTVALQSAFSSATTVSPNGGGRTV